ncbi:hypothetical protein [Neobacillus kokaensis]|uniref:Uncharacterized protein n=1 Tax=Neobacillus kokaensis TaxID=2759023 RepID=A0ABQ3NB80_9BACI|nr:hypothetical protein [Neobacillus kokaensis]GHI01177.1 hypothetical protein AM1BK_47190 [Neobacillus kokaensis]
MIIIFIKFLLPAFLLIYLLQRTLDKYDSKSKAMLVLLLISLVFNTALAQNYNYNLIPYPERDGYSISNMLAYYVFGENYFGHWNLDLFKSGYEISIYVTIILLIIYVSCLIFERRKKEKE